ncbi:MAG: cytochrome d ubiquinol oxidase subunit II [Bacteroidetes bacterium]|nr:cytochrome d ubiquinol oxidase subunit II [Bacteroidota bacterium]
MTISFLQHYWWALVSLLGALLVFLLFVQGGQSLIWVTAKNSQQRSLLVNLLGHKWELTFTTLVTFGGAIFASFPLYYSTSFGGAYWLWITILLLFVIQAVSYEFRSKAGNLLGQKTYDGFLFLNGLLGTVLLGVAVGTFFTGGAFIMDKTALVHTGGPVISKWANGWHGLDALAHPFNLLMGVGVYAAACTMALLFTIQSIDDAAYKARALKQLRVVGTVFVLGFVVLLVYLFCLTGYRADPVTGHVTPQTHIYLHNMLELVWPAVILLLGVVLVLWGLGCAFFEKGKYNYWITSIGVVLAVFPLLICAAFNNTAYFASTVDPHYSLTLVNSSSSIFTLKVMSYVSLLIPFVLAYIAYVWYVLTKKPMGKTDLEAPDVTVY